MNLAPGIYPDIPEDVYHADALCDVPTLSSSMCKILVGKSAAHAFYSHPRLNRELQREEKELFDLGTISHALMLQGLSVAVVLKHDNWKTKAAREERDFVRSVGKIPVLESNWARCLAMVTAGKKQLAAHKEAADAFTKGKPEQTMIWQDDHGVMCRARVDWLHDSLLTIDDLKTTGRSANPDGLERVIYSMGWDVQSAFYLRGLEKLDPRAGAVNRQFRFIAQENVEPYALSVIGVHPTFEWSGRQNVQKAIDLWAKCLKSNKWPGYPDRIAYPELPKYAESKMIEAELQEVSN
jgi:hypothetical protein